MKNIDKIRQMNSHELAGIIGNSECKYCVAHKFCNTMSDSCQNIIQEWLGAENKELKYTVECAELRNKYDKEQFDKQLQQVKAENKELREKLEIAKNFIFDIRTIDIIKPEVIGDIIERIE